MRAAFFGTPPAAIPILAGLAEVADVTTVVTRPDKPRGRSKKLHAPAVKEAAEYFGFRVVQPRRAAEVVEDLDGDDVAVVAAYGQILPKALLDVPKTGFVNVHFSLLPRWRGAAPVARAIAAGDRETGVTLMQLDEGLDTGPTFARAVTPIENRETAGDLTARLSSLGSRLLVSHLADYVSGTLALESQDDSLATTAPKLEPSEARLRAESQPETAARLVRAYNPAPGAWFEIGGNRIKLWEVQAIPAVDLEPGSLSVADNQVILGLEGGGLQLLVVQPAGKRRMAAIDWANGFQGSLPRLD